MTVRSTPSLATIELSTEQFRYVSGLVTGISGIRLSSGKGDLVRSRLAKRVRALGLANMQDYLDRVERDTTRAELAEMVDALTTNKTSFFREIEHFRLLQRSLLPDLARGHAPIRIWSAGCSTGEEPYTIAMVARETLRPDATRVRILADRYLRSRPRAGAGRRVQPYCVAGTSLPICGTRTSSMSQASPTGCASLSPPARSFSSHN